MDKKSNNLFRKLAEDCGEAVREFPVALFFLAIFAIVIGCPDVKYPLTMTFGVPCLLACVGSLAASLVSVGRSRIMAVAGQATVIVLAFLYILILDRSSFYEFRSFRYDNHLEIYSSITGYALVLLTLVFFPFWRKSDSVDESWSTTMRGFVGVMRAAIVALSVLIAMTIITFGGNALLGIEIFGQFWLTFVPMMLFGSLSIASFSIKNAVKRPVFRLAPFSKGAFTLVSVPLLVIYLLIFYIYLVDVLLTGTTPVRDLSFQAIGVFLAYCAQSYIFHQALRDGDNAVACWFNRLSPWLLLLPVVMMSWVIGHRMMKYGLTVSRLYVLLVNLWMYGVIIWWIMTKGRKIWVIPVSFCAVIALSSITPLNVTTVTEASMRSNLKKAMIDAGWALPVSDSYFRQHAWESLTASLRSQKSYLENEMGIESLAGLVTFDHIRKEKQDDKETIWALSDNDDKRLHISSRCNSSFDSIPVGCVAVNLGEVEANDIALVNDSVIVSIGDYGALVFSLGQLRAVGYNGSGFDRLPVTTTAGNIKGASITYIYLNAEIEDGCFRGDTYCRLSGTIFLPRETAARFKEETK